MATTTTVDLTAIANPVVVTDTLEAYYATPGLRGLAEESRALSGARPGDRIRIGSFVGSTAALNLTETEEIVPKKFAASSREFIVGRIGDAYEYSIAANRFSADDLQARSTRYLGQAAALRVDLNLAATLTSSVLAGRTITATGTGAAAVLTPDNFIAAVRTFPDEVLPQVRAVLTTGQRNQLTDAIRNGGTAYTGNTVWNSGAIDSFYGVPILTDSRLPTTTASRAAAVFLVPNRTLVSAMAIDPIIDLEYFPKKATIDVVLNAWWAGGVQDRDTLTLIDAAA